VAVITRTSRILRFVGVLNEYWLCCKKRKKHSKNGILPFFHSMKTATLVRFPSLAEKIRFLYWLPEISILSTFPRVGILSSRDQLLRRLKWSGESRNAPVFALVYLNGDSSLFAKEQE
jgi:hypothetical protein